MSLLTVVKLVGVVGFEPTIFCSQSRRDSQVTLHSDRRDTDLLFSESDIFVSSPLDFGNPFRDCYLGCCMYLKPDGSALAHFLACRFNDPAHARLEHLNLRFWWSIKESNLCLDCVKVPFYHYTNRPKLAEVEGFEPSPVLPGQV